MAGERGGRHFPCMVLMVSGDFISRLIEANLSSIGERDQRVENILYHHRYTFTGFLRASARGAERVNGSYRQNQRDEGGGMVSEFMEHFVPLLTVMVKVGQK